MRTLFNRIKSESKLQSQLWLVDQKHRRTRFYRDEELENLTAKVNGNKTITDQLSMVNRGFLLEIPAVNQKIVTSCKIYRIIVELISPAPHATPDYIICMGSLDDLNRIQSRICSVPWGKHTYHGLRADNLSLGDEFPAINLFLHDMTYHLLF